MKQGLYEKGQGGDIKSPAERKADGYKIKNVRCDTLLLLIEIGLK